MKVDAFGQGREELRPAGNELRHIVTVGKLKRAGQLPVNGVFHNDIQNSTAVIHHDIQFGFHVGNTVVLAGNLVNQSDRRSEDHITTGCG